MKKRIAKIFFIIAFFAFESMAIISAQNIAKAPNNVPEKTNSVLSKEMQQDEQQTYEQMETPIEEQPMSLHKILKQKFIEGGPAWMAPIALCLIIGLALCIERIIYLNLASTNSKKLLQDIDEAWSKGGIEAAMEVCRKTKGPVASIFYQALSRYDEGIEVVEKAVASYGGVQLGLMETNLTWISLFIALSPGLGFLGTVVGMIQAFDRIQQVGDISATIVASGIKVALLTTVFGLIVAMVLQVFYNYILTMVENITNDMEDASISLLDIIVKHSKN
jgi:biopolymer transport protein ExbB